MKTKPILKRFGGTFGTLRLDEKSFLYTLLGLLRFWNKKSTNARRVDSPAVSTNQMILHLSTINKNHMKCDCIDGSFKNGLKQPILYNFNLDKPNGYKVFCQPETTQFKKVSKPVLNTRTFYLEDNENDEVNFNGETLTYTMQLVKT